ncbi:MAG: DMT family transporter [Verrucomicrobiales bacterium]
MFAALLTTCFFAFAAFAGGRTSRLFGGLNAAFYRSILALGFLLVVMGLGQRSWSVPSSAFWWLLASGVIGFGMGDLALYIAFRLIGSRLAVLLCQCLAVPIALLTEWLWLGTATSTEQLLSITAILVGVCLVLLPRENPGRSVRDLWLGIPLGVVAAVGQGLGAVFSRRAYEVFEETTPDVVLVTLIRLAGGFGFLILWWSVFSKNRSALTGPQLALGWPWLLTNAMLGPFLGVMAYQYALAVAPSGPVLAIVATTPIAIIPLSRFFDGEHITRLALLGSLLACVGVVGLLTR